MPPKKIPSDELQARLSAARARFYEKQGKKIYQDTLSTIPGIQLLGFETAVRQYNTIELAKDHNVHPSLRLWTAAEEEDWLVGLLSKYQIQGEYLFHFNLRETGKFYLWARGILSAQYEWVLPVWKMTGNGEMWFLSLDATQSLELYKDEFYYMAEGYGFS
jgi:hypothetical protein